jgi:steroid 3-oxidase
MTKLIQKIIQEKRENRTYDAPHDMIDVLMSNGSDELTDELISDNMIDFMIPAEDSVPVLITLAVKYLNECPMALEQLEVCVSYNKYYVETSENKNTTTPKLAFTYY